METEKGSGAYQVKNPEESSHDIPKDHHPREEWQELTPKGHHPRGSSDPNPKGHHPREGTGIESKIERTDKA
eukprot:7177350-Karenia_brevis.AAC.1